MNTLILFVKQKKRWLINDWIKQHNGVDNHNGSLMIECSDGWLSISNYAEFEDEYDNDEKKEVYSLIDDPTFYAIEWKGEGLLIDFINWFPKDSGIVIDNDHGLICYMDELKGLDLSKWLTKCRVD